MTDCGFRFEDDKTLDSCVARGDGPLLNRHPKKFGGFPILPKRTPMTTEIVDPVEIRKLMGELHRQALGAVLPATAAQEATREVTMVLSDESVDSYGTIFKVDGWTDLRKGGVPLLLQHQRDAFPVGRIHALEKSTRDGRRVLLAHARFTPEGIDPEADRAYKLAKAGIMTDVSVGFDPHAIDPVKDPEQRKALGLPPGGFVFTRQTLLEGSLVSIGSNKNAQTLAVRHDEATYGWLNGVGPYPSTVTLGSPTIIRGESISGGNEEEPTLRDLLALQGARLEAIERAVQTLLARDIGGNGGAPAPAPAPQPKSGDSLYRALLGKAETPTSRGTDARPDPAGPNRQPGEPHS